MFKQIVSLDIDNVWRIIGDAEVLHFIESSNQTKGDVEGGQKRKISVACFTRCLQQYPRSRGLDILRGRGVVRPWEWGSYLTGDPFP